MSNPSSPTASNASSNTARLPTVNPTLRPAVFGQPTGPSTAGVQFPTPPLAHWSLSSQIDTSRYLTLCGRLPHKLTASNYVSWMVATESSLDMIDLASYINGDITPRQSHDTDYQFWRVANALVRSILVTNMSEEIVVQVSHLKIAKDIWDEAKCLFSGQTLTDFTLTITVLVTTKYVDGEDVTTHLAKMKGLHRDLTLMGRDVDNGLFACFLRISMPPTWNYVFAGLPNNYTSAEVERRVKDEYGIKTNQETVAMAYRTGQIPGKAKSGNVTCDNCHCEGHTKTKCCSPGGGAEGKGPRQKRKKKKGDNSKDKEEKKSKEKANQAVEDNSEDDDEHEAFMAITSPHSHSCFRWVLDGGSTTHICTDRNMFATFTNKQSSIRGIQKNAPALQSIGFGDVHLTCMVDGKSERTITLMNIVYCPDARDNLISESRMDRKGLEIRKRKGLVNVLRTDGSILMQGHLNGSLYELNCHASPSSTSPEFAFNTRYTHSLNLWHRRLAYVNEDALLYMAKHSLVTRMDLHTNGSLGPCDGCVKGKHPQAPFPNQAENQAESPLGRLHMDIQGPFKGSIAGFQYTLAVIDDHSRARWK